jgi:hypothetical protein
MSRFHRNLLMSGLGGLLAGGLLAVVAARLVVTGVITPPLPWLPVTVLSVLVFGAFSLAEIPIMVFTMRRLLAERPENQGVVMGLNTIYVFFAAVYGVPVLLLTGSVAWGLALCTLCVVRFFTSLAFVREPLP